MLFCSFLIHENPQLVGRPYLNNEAEKPRQKSLRWNNGSGVESQYQEKPVGTSTNEREMFITYEMEMPVSWEFPI